jgi:hypothetical protein
MGIEPTSEAWEASILPLYDARSMHIVPAKWSSEKPFAAAGTAVLFTPPAASQTPRQRKTREPLPNNSLRNRMMHV